MAPSWALRSAPRLRLRAPRDAHLTPVERWLHTIDERLIMPDDGDERAQRPREGFAIFNVRPRARRLRARVDVRAGVTTSIQVKSQLGNPAVKAAVTSLLDAANTIARPRAGTQSWVSRTLAGEMRSETTDPLDWVQTCTRSGHTRISFARAHKRSLTAFCCILLARALTLKAASSRTSRRRSSPTATSSRRR